MIMDQEEKNLYNFLCNYSLLIAFHCNKINTIMKCGYKKERAKQKL